jgi:hypothetical protein
MPDIQATIRSNRIAIARSLDALDSAAQVPVPPAKSHLSQLTRPSSRS